MICKFCKNLSDFNSKYTNPAKGILDFCEQKLTAPPMKPLELTHNGLDSMYVILNIHANSPKTLRNTL